MNVERIETVRRAVGFLNEHDLDSALEAVHPHVVFDWTASNAPYAGVYDGADAAMDRLREFFDIWEDVRWDLEEVFETPPNHVIAVTRVDSRGRAGLVTGARGAWVWEFDGDRASRVTLCQSREEAVRLVRGDHSAG